MPSTDILKIAETLRMISKEKLDIEWVTPDAIVRARNLLSEELSMLLKQWRTFAEKNGWPVDRLLRNVLARARFEELSYLQKIVEIALEEEADESRRKALTSLKACFPQPFSNLALHLLQTTGPTLPVEVLRRYTRNWQECMEALTFHAPVRPSPLELLRILATFPPDHFPPHYLSTEAFASKWSALGWPVLSDGTLSRLSRAIREKILGNPGGAGRLHSPGGISDINAASSSGNYTSPLFLKAVLRHDHTLRTSLARHCAGGHPALSESASMESSNVRRITARLPTATGALWRYLLTPPDIWVSMLRRGREAEMFIFPVEISHVLKKLSASTITRPADYELLLGPADEQDRQQIFEAVLERFKDGEGIPESLLKKWLTFLGKNALLSAILSRPRDYSFVREKAFWRLPKPILEALAASISDVASLKSVLQCLGKSLPEILHESRSRTLRWARTVYNHEKKAGTESEAVEFLAKPLSGKLTHLEWAGIVPDTVGLMELRNAIGQHPFADSISSNRHAVCNLVRRLYRQSIESEGIAQAVYFLSQCVADLRLTLEEVGCPSFSTIEMTHAIPLRESFAIGGSLLGCWKLFKVAFKDLEQRITEKNFRHLVADLKKGGTQLCLLAYVALPQKFTALLAETQPLEAVWHFSHTNAILAHALERRHGRGALMKLLPEIRVRFENNPVLRCAYELAACFSLADASYLLHLSRIVARAKGRSTYRSGMAFDSLYSRSSVRKKSGGMRLITAPKPLLKRLQKRILQNGFSHLPLPDSCHGFREGRSIVTNAAPHVGKPLVVNVDIKAFFPSTTHAQIKRVLWKHYSRTLSDSALGLLSEICCLDGALPTGAPTSPVLANLVLAPVDRALEKATARFGVTYTRYADDLTFSGTEDCKKILPLVRKLIAQRGYELDSKKTQLYRRGRRQMVTGLVVNDKPNVPRKVRRLLRASVHRSANGAPPIWEGQPMTENALRGRLAQLARVQPQEFQVLKSKLNQAI